METLHSHTPEGKGGGSADCHAGELSGLLQHALTPQGLAFLHTAGDGSSSATAAASVFSNSFGCVRFGMGGGDGELPDRLVKQKRVKLDELGKFTRPAFILPPDSSV